MKNTKQNGNVWAGGGVVLVGGEGEEEVVEVDRVEEGRRVAQAVVRVELRLVQHQHARSLQRGLQLLPLTNL